MSKYKTQVKVDGKGEQKDKAKSQQSSKAGDAGREGPKSKMRIFYLSSL